MIDHLLRDDRSLMLEAVQLAARAPGRPWPNPPVGALVVRDDGTILGRGRHEGAGTPHAEILALEEAGPAARGATLYSTLEPCNHQGRTPPCAPRVVASGVRRLVVGVRDANPAVEKGGLDLIRRAGISVCLGVAGREALELIWPFAATRGFQRPYILLKTATSIDGRFAPARDPGITAPVYLTGVEARREVHRLRRWADLVLVGSRTILADRPTLDGRLVGEEALCPAIEPMPGYVDTDLSVNMSWPGRSHLVFGGRDSATPARVQAVQEAGGHAVLCAERSGWVDPGSLVEHLAASGVRTVMLEGGPTLAHSFLGSDLVDRWVSFVAPLALGEGPTWPQSSPDIEPVGPSARAGTGRFHLTRCERAGGDAMLVLDRLAFDEALRRLTEMPEA